MKHWFFWNGESKGTAREIKMLAKSQKPYQVFNIGKPENGIENELFQPFEWLQ